MNKIQAAIDAVGSQAKLAREIGCAQQVVNNWIRRGNVPAERCIDIERATHGAVTCEDLRPDVDWAYLRGTDKAIVPAIEAAPECASGDPRHGIDRRRPDPRTAERRKEAA